MIKKIGSVIEKVIYTLILIPLILITISVSCQIIFSPDKIPNILGYKFFIILDGNMDDLLDYGDFIITKNKETYTLSENDLIAFRNGMNTVTIHKIDKIELNSENNQVISFTMKTLSSETNDMKYVKEEHFEGLVVHRIPKIGMILYFIQKPMSMLIISCIILCIGAIATIIAGILDEREKKQKTI